MILDSSFRSVAILPETWCEGFPQDNEFRPQPDTFENLVNTQPLPVGIVSLLGVIDEDYRGIHEVAPDEEVRHDLLIRSGVKTRRIMMNVIRNAVSEGDIDPEINQNYYSFGGQLHVDSPEGQGLVTYSISNSNPTLMWNQRFWVPNRNIGILRGPLLRAQARRKNIVTPAPNELRSYRSCDAVHALPPSMLSDADRTFARDVVAGPDRIRKNKVITRA